MTLMISSIFHQNNEKPVKITSMVVSSSANFINTIRVTYLTSKGTSTSITHGILAQENLLGRSNFALLNFDTDEWITRVNISSRPSFSKPVKGQHVFLIISK